MRSLISVFIFTLIPITYSYSEIKDKRVYDSFYEGCMLERDTSFTYQEMSNYCECAGKGVMKNFTVKELMILEGKIIAADKDDELKVAVANEKFMSVISSCVSKIIN